MPSTTFRNLLSPFLWKYVLTFIESVHLPKLFSTHPGFERHRKDEMFLRQRCQDRLMEIMGSSGLFDRNVHTDTPFTETFDIEQFLSSAGDTMKQEQWQERRFEQVVRRIDALYRKFDYHDIFLHLPIVELMKDSGEHLDKIAPGYAIFECILRCMRDGIFVIERPRDPVHGTSNECDSILIELHSMCHIIVCKSNQGVHVKWFGTIYHSRQEITQYSNVTKFSIELFGDYIYSLRAKSVRKVNEGKPRILFVDQRRSLHDHLTYEKALQRYDANNFIVKGRRVMHDPPFHLFRIYPDGWAKEICLPNGDRYKHTLTTWRPDGRLAARGEHGAMCQVVNPTRVRTVYRDDGYAWSGFWTSGIPVINSYAAGGGWHNSVDSPTDPRATEAISMGKCTLLTGAVEQTLYHVDDIYYCKTCAHSLRSSRVVFSYGRKRCGTKHLFW